MIPSSVYLGELLYLWFKEAPKRGLQLWSNLFDESLQRWNIQSCNGLLRELCRLDIQTEVGANAAILYKMGRGTLAAHMGDLEKSSSIYESVLPDLPFEEAGWVLVNLGNVYYLSRQFEQAMQYYQRAGDVYEQSNFLPGLAKVKINMGCIHRDNGNPASAITLFEQAFSMIPVEDIETRLINLTNWANALHVSGQMDKAEAKYQEALHMVEQINAPHLQAKIIGNLGILYLDQDNLEKAIEFISKDLSTQIEFGDFSGQAEALNNLGIAYRKNGQINSALDCYQRSADIRSGLGDKHGELTNLRNYVIATRKNTLPIPARVLRRAIQLAEELEDSGTDQWLQGILLGSDETDAY